MNPKKCVKSLPPKVEAPALSVEEERELDYNICCCIEDIETTLSKHPSEKQKRLAEVSLKILKNPGESFIRKKQVMRQWCGDYKKKYEGEKKKLVANMNNCKVGFGSSEASQKSLFIKKHTLKSHKDNSNVEKGAIEEKKTSDFTGSNSFRFDF